MLVFEAECVTLMRSMSTTHTTIAVRLCYPLVDGREQFYKMIAWLRELLDDHEHIKIIDDGSEEVADLMIIVFIPGMFPDGFMKQAIYEMTRSKLVWCFNLRSAPPPHRMILDWINDHRTTGDVFSFDHHTDIVRAVERHLSELDPSIKSSDDWRCIMESMDPEGKMTALPPHRSFS